MSDLRTETLDDLEVRASRRLGLISLGLVTGSFVVAMAMAVFAKGSDDAAARAADCQRSERAAATTEASSRAKSGPLLLCSAESGLLQRLF